MSKEGREEEYPYVIREELDVSEKQGCVPSIGVLDGAGVEDVESRHYRHTKSSRES